MLFVSYIFAEAWYFDILYNLNIPIQISKYMKNTLNDDTHVDDIVQHRNIAQHYSTAWQSLRGKLKDKTRWDEQWQQLHPSNVGSINTL